MSNAAPPNFAAAQAPAAAAAGAAAAPKAKKKVTAKKATGAGTKVKAKKPAAPRTKKPAAPKKTAAANTEAIFADAAAAQRDLAKQRSHAAARRLDPLWYRIEDVLPAHEVTPMTSGILPDQVTVVEKALSHAGLTRSDVTPQAMACLLEQARRVAQELTTAALDYAYSAGRPDIVSADLLLAQELRPDQAHTASVATQLPKLNLVAQQVNRAPLPPIPSQCYTGILLPPKQHQLTARTFDIVSASVIANKMVQAVPPSPAALRKQQQQPSMPGYGASRGRQIPIALKQQQQQPSSAATLMPVTAAVPMDVTATTSPTNTTANTMRPPSATAGAAAAAGPQAMSLTSGLTANPLAPQSAAASAPPPQPPPPPSQ